jgi:hypothetical protein
MAEVFVFGSNRQGRHGAGAALFARQHYGVVYGVAQGRQVNAYAIVTKELRRHLPPVTLQEIADQVPAFYEHCRANPEDTFIVTKVGCGLAGFNESEIAPLFADAPSNVHKPEGW